MYRLKTDEVYSLFNLPSHCSFIGCLPFTWMFCLMFFLRKPILFEGFAVTRLMWWLKFKWDETVLCLECRIPAILPPMSLKKHPSVGPRAHLEDLLIFCRLLPFSYLGYPNEEKWIAEFSLFTWYLSMINVALGIDFAISPIQQQRRKPQFHLAEGQKSYFNIEIVNVLVNSKLNSVQKLCGTGFSQFLLLYVI